MDGIYRVLCFPYTLVYIREIFQQNRQKTGYVELNIEQSYCKLTLKASEDVLPGNNRFFLNSQFSFSSSSLSAVTQEHRRLLECF